jgi:hypothetical protein
LTTRDEELERLQETNRRETTHRRDIEEELGTMTEDLCLANIENQSYRARQTQERPGGHDPGGGDRAGRRSDIPISNNYDRHERRDHGRRSDMPSQQERYDQGGGRRQPDSHNRTWHQDGNRDYSRGQTGGYVDQEGRRRADDDWNGRNSSGQSPVSSDFGMMMINDLKDATTAAGGPGRNRII